MKKFSRFLGLVLAALVLMPISVMAQLYPTLTFRDATGAPVRQVEATLNEDFIAPTLTCDEYPDVVRYVRYSSTNPRVAWADSISGYIELYSAGQTTITAYFAGDSVYSAARATYMLIVKEAETPVTPDTLVCPEAHYNLPSADNVLYLEVGQTASIPELLGATGTVYQLSRKSILNEQVAKLTEDGMIYAVGEGSTVFSGMTFQVGADGNTLTCDYTFDIAVKGGETPEEPTCPEARYFYNGAVVDTMFLNVGEAIDIPLLMTAAGETIYGRGVVEDPQVATVTADNRLYMLAEGFTNYVVTYLKSTAAGDSLQCAYYLPLKVAATTQLLDPELSFDQKDIYLELGDEVVAPKLINPHDIVFTSNNCKWYTNWESTVARVDEQSGVITLVGGTGDETIYFEFTGNDEYRGAAASFVIHVSTTGLIVGGILVTNSNKDQIPAGNGYIFYDPITHTLTMVDAVISTENVVIEGAPARAKADQQISAGIYYSDAHPLTVMLIGSNAIVYGDAGIFSESAPVTMIGDSIAGGSIRISGATVGVKAEAYKIYKSSVVASGNAAGVAVDELSVATGGYLLAQGQGLAIQANQLVLADGGEGVAILTEGVTFTPKIGFLKDGKPATIVEIGKVPVVVPEDEVTTIDFTQTDPEGNETVVFSTSVNDTYNETTGQLEISTQLTDAQVEEALESLVPGSSAWVDMLPGSLVFDIPAGEGELKVKCLTLPGYKLQVKIEGQAAVSVEMAELGWAKVSYNVAAPVHVVIYLHAPEGASAPARIATRMQDAVEAHAYIEAVEIAPAKAPQGLENIVVDGDQTTKILFDGQIYILREGHIFTVQGAEVR